jgi:hypothetical protein
MTKMGSYYDHVIVDTVALAAEKLGEYLRKQGRDYTISVIKPDPDKNGFQVTTLITRADGKIAEAHYHVPRQGTVQHLSTGKDLSDL